MADLIQQAYRKHIKIWAAYGAPDWPSLGCAANSFPMQRMAELKGCDGDTAGTALAANLETAVGEPPNRSTSAARRHDAESSCQLPLRESHGAFGGFAVHRYQDSYLSGRTGWPAIHTSR